MHLICPYDACAGDHMIVAVWEGVYSSITMTACTICKDIQLRVLHQLQYSYKGWLIQVHKNVKNILYQITQKYLQHAVCAVTCPDRQNTLGHLSHEDVLSG